MWKRKILSQYWTFYFIVLRERECERERAHSFSEQILHKICEHLWAKRSEGGLQYIKLFYKRSSGNNNLLNK